MISDQVHTSFQEQQRKALLAGERHIEKKKAGKEDELTEIACRNCTPSLRLR